MKRTGIINQGPESLLVQIETSIHILPQIFFYLFLRSKN